MRILVWSGRRICYGVLKGGAGEFGGCGSFFRGWRIFFGGGDGCAVFFAAGAAFWRGWLVLRLMLRDISTLGV